MKKIIRTVLMLVVVSYSVNAQQETEQIAKQAAEQNAEKVAVQSAEEVAGQKEVEEAAQNVAIAAGKIIIATWNINDMLTASEVTSMSFCP